jgi:pimeloyl-ACP methyl ester carboxylesterase
MTSEQTLWSKLGVAPSGRRVRLPAGNEVRVQEIGQGSPLVFIHGAAVAGSSWGGLAAGLRDEFRCILVDRPGCGLSDPIPDGPLRSPAEFKRFADEFTAQLLDGLELDAASLACTSMGGFFGFRAAIAHPNRVTKLVEYSWAMGTPMAKVPAMMRIGSVRPLKAIMPRMPLNRSAVKMMLKQVGMKRAIESGAFDDDMLAWVVATMKHTDTLKSETDNNTFISLKGENREFLFTDEELDRVQMPVLLVWGDEDTNGGAPEAHAFAARLPNATLEMIERAGHAPWIDQVELCVSRTRAFLHADPEPSPLPDLDPPTPR